jgi:hypothetical protein
VTAAAFADMPLRQRPLAVQVDGAKRDRSRDGPPAIGVVDEVGADVRTNKSAISS